MLIKLMRLIFHKSIRILPSHQFDYRSTLPFHPATSNDTFPAIIVSHKFWKKTDFIPV
ncbi:MAG: hypothetical protein AB7U82_20825 [Blastocatellales bacterium]